MLNKLLGIAIVAFMCAVSITELSAQVKEEQKKIVIVEKVVDNNGQVVETKKVLEGEAAEQYMKEKNMEVEKSSSSFQKMFKIKVKDDEGNEKTLNWNGEGEMPAEMKKLMEEGGLNHLNKDGGEHSKKKRVKIVTKNGDQSSVEEYEIEGDELPDEVMKKLDEHGIDSGEITQTIKMDDTGGKKMMMIKKEGDGLEEVLDFDWEGDELPDEVRKILQQEGIEIEETIGADGQKEFKVTAKAEAKAPSSKSGKAQLGVLIEKNILGALISRIVPKSAAEEAGLQVGDIITNVNNTKIIAVSDLIMTLADYKPSDEISVRYIRDSKNQETTVTLKERIDPFPYKTWESVMKNGHKEIEIEIDETVIKHKSK